MKPPQIGLDEIRALGEPCLRMKIPAEWADRNGHMNMRWYVAIYDDAGDELHVRVGLQPERLREINAGTFDLEHHTHFVAEVTPGDEVAVYARLVSSSAKRYHYLMFLVNETRGRLASIFECVNGMVDMGARRTRAYPPEMEAEIAAAVAAHAGLGWVAPVCGVMGA